MPDIGLLTVPQAAKWAQVRQTKMYELVARRIVPSIRLGPRCIRVPLAGLEEWALEEARKSLQQEGGRTA